MKNIVGILFFITLIGSVVWFIYSPGFEPGIAILTSFTSLIGIWLKNEQETKKIKQMQTLGDDAIGIQAGGNVTVGDIIKRNSDA